MPVNGLRYRNPSSWRHHWLLASLPSAQKSAFHIGVSKHPSANRDWCLPSSGAFPLTRVCNRRRLRWSGLKRLTWPSTRGSRRSTYETVCEVLSFGFLRTLDEVGEQSSRRPLLATFARVSLRTITRGEKRTDRAELMSAEVRLFCAQEGPSS